jgi:histidinol-phosphatase (PHP family)
MSWTNYHSHCYYCDGKYAPEEYIKSAKNKGLLAYGFSSHAPVPFDCVWTMKTESAPAYVAEIRALQQAYQRDIELYCGMEVDYIPGITGPKSLPILQLGLDYTIGSVHFVDVFPDGRRWEIDGSHQVFLDGLQQIFSGDIRQAVSRYFELTRQMIEQECPDVIGHIDKIKIQDEDGNLFSQQAGWYQQELEQTLRLIADAGAMVEINTRGIYKKKTGQTYPGKWALEKMKALSIPVTINSDAHHPDEIILQFEDTAALLASVGYKQVSVLLDGRWQQLNFDQTGLLQKATP